VGVVALILCIATLAVTGVLLLSAGAHQNAQVVGLETNGRPVEATVTTCVGQLGGSGSNGAGFACRAAYRFGGRVYVATLPGSDSFAPGTRVAIVVDAADPALISTPRLVATQHPSDRVYVLPAVLLACALVIAAVLVLWLRRHRRRSSRQEAQSVSRSLPDLGDDDRLGALGGV
jgi:hypothetical protein